KRGTAGICQGRQGLAPAGDNRADLQIRRTARAAGAGQEPRQPGSQSQSLCAQATYRQGRSKIAFSEVSASVIAASMSPAPPLASALANMSATMYCVCDWAVFLLGSAGQPGHLPGATTS